jgi:hypothetical protein
MILFGSIPQLAVMNALGWTWRMRLESSTGENPDT